MLFYYIRHADPIYQPDSITPLGARQAEALAKRLALFGLDKIYVSTSNRAIQTAQPTCELLKIVPELLDFCNESYAFNEFSIIDEQGKKRWIFEDARYRRLLASAEVRQLGDKWYMHPVFGEEKFRSGIERIHREADRFLLSLGYEHDINESVYKVVRPNNDRVALFAYAGFGILFLSYVLDISFPEFSIHFDMCHTGMTVIEFAEVEGYAIPKVKVWSDDAHLYREGLPLNYNNRLRF